MKLSDEVQAERDRVRKAVVEGWERPHERVALAAFLLSIAIGVAIVVFVKML